MNRKSVFIFFPFKTMAQRTTSVIIGVIIILALMCIFFKTFKFEGRYVGILLISLAILLFCKYKIKEKICENIAHKILNSKDRPESFRAIKDGEYLVTAFFKTEISKQKFTELLHGAKLSDICKGVSWIDFYFEVFYPLWCFTIFLCNISIIPIALIIYIITRIVLEYIIDMNGLDKFFK